MIFDTSNKFKVRSPDNGQSVYFETPKPSSILIQLTAEEAVFFAAWLCEMSRQATVDIQQARNEICE